MADDPFKHSVMQAKQRIVLLVSPAPVDGYPPVQYQAQLLIEAGFKVILLTSPLRDRAGCDFQLNGLETYCVRLTYKSKLAAVFAKLRFIFALARQRLIQSELTAEIHYDPEGVTLARFTPRMFRKCKRIAHLHETLIDPTKRIHERIASKILPTLDKIVVADGHRGEIIRRQLGLTTLPLVVENFPLDDGQSLTNTSIENYGFRVVYAGVLGANQNIDTIIESIPMWDNNCSLHLLGNDKTDFAASLKKQAERLGVLDRVSFYGWKSLNEVRLFLQTCHLGLCILKPVHDQLKFAAGASNKRFQYMQAGIAQISDNNPGVTDYVEDVGAGSCIIEQTPQAIAERVNYYARNPLACRSAGQKANVAFKTRYNYAVPFKALIDFINE